VSCYSVIAGCLSGENAKLAGNFRLMMQCFDQHGKVGILPVKYSMYVAAGAVCLRFMAYLCMHYILYAGPDPELSDWC
jgi:hypothetical protein